MRTFGVSEAKLKFLKLITIVSAGETIGITRYGKLVAFVTPVCPTATLKEIFDDFERVRRRASLRGVTVESLIEEGRR